MGGGGGGGERMGKKATEKGKVKGEGGAWLKRERSEERGES